MSKDRKLSPQEYEISQLKWELKEANRKLGGWIANYCELKAKTQAQVPGSGNTVLLVRQNETLRKRLDLTKKALLDALCAAHMEPPCDVCGP